MLKSILFFCIVDLSIAVVLFEDDMITNNTKWETIEGDVTFMVDDSDCPVNDICTELKGDSLSYSSITSYQISTINYHHISLQYDIRLHLVDGDDTCYAQYSYDNGVNWNNLANYTEDVEDISFVGQVKYLNNLASNINNLRIRMYFFASQTDYCYISNIILTGDDITHPPTSQTTNRPTTNEPTTNEPTTNPLTTSTTNEPTTHAPTTHTPTTNVPTTYFPTYNPSTTGLTRNTQSVTMAPTIMSSTDVPISEGIANQNTYTTMESKELMNKDSSDSWSLLIYLILGCSLVIIGIVIIFGFLMIRKRRSGHLRKQVEIETICDVSPAMSGTITPNTINITPNAITPNMSSVQLTTMGQSIGDTELIKDTFTLDDGEQDDDDDMYTQPQYATPLHPVTERETKGGHGDVYNEDNFHGRNNVTPNGVNNVTDNGLQS